MKLIPLAEWAVKNGMSRRKAEYLAKESWFPCKKERRTYKVQRWVTVVDEDYKPPKSQGEVEKSACAE